MGPSAMARWVTPAPTLTSAARTEIWGFPGLSCPRCPQVCIHQVRTQAWEPSAVPVQRDRSKGANSCGEGMDPTCENPPTFAGADKHPNKQGLMQLSHAGRHQPVSLLPGEGERRCPGGSGVWGGLGTSRSPSCRPVNIQSGCDKKQLLGPQVGRCQVVHTEL